MRAFDHEFVGDSIRRIERTTDGATKVNLGRVYGSVPEISQGQVRATTDAHRGGAVDRVVVEQCTGCEEGKQVISTCGKDVASMEIETSAVETEWSARFAREKAHEDGSATPRGSFAAANAPPRVVGTWTESRRDPPDHPKPLAIAKHARPAGSSPRPHPCVETHDFFIFVIVACAHETWISIPDILFFVIFVSNCLGVVVRVLRRRTTGDERVFEATPETKSRRASPLPLRVDERERSVDGMERGRTKVGCERDPNDVVGATHDTATEVGRAHLAWCFHDMQVTKA